MANVVAEVAEQLHKLDKAAVSAALQVFPANIDHRVSVLEAAAKLLDLISGSKDLIKTIQDVAKKRKEHEETKNANTQKRLDRKAAA